LLKKSNTTFFKIRFIARIVSSFIFETQQFKTLEQDLVNVGQASSRFTGNPAQAGQWKFEIYQLLQPLRYGVL